MPWNPTTGFVAPPVRHAQGFNGLTGMPLPNSGQAFNDDELAAGAGKFIGGPAPGGPMAPAGWSPINRGGGGGMGQFGFGGGGGGGGGGHNWFDNPPVRFGNRGGDFAPPSPTAASSNPGWMNTVGTFGKNTMSPMGLSFSEREANAHDTGIFGNNQSWDQPPRRAYGGPAAPGAIITGDPQADGGPNPEMVISSAPMHVIPLRNMPGAPPLPHYAYGTDTFVNSGPSPAPPNLEAPMSIDPRFANFDADKLNNQAQAARDRITAFQDEQAANRRQEGAAFEVMDRRNQDVLAQRKASQDQFNSNYNTAKFGMELPSHFLGKSANEPNSLWDVVTADNVGFANNPGQKYLKEEYDPRLKSMTAAMNAEPKMDPFWHINDKGQLYQGGDENNPITIPTPAAIPSTRNTAASAPTPSMPPAAAPSTQYGSTAQPTPEPSAPTVPGSYAFGSPSPRSYASPQPLPSAPATPPAPDMFAPGAVQLPAGPAPAPIVMPAAAPAPQPAKGWVPANDPLNVYRIAAGRKVTDDPQAKAAWDAMSNSERVLMQRQMRDPRGASWLHQAEMAQGAARNKMDFDWTKFNIGRQDARDLHAATDARAREMNDARVEMWNRREQQQNSKLDAQQKHQADVTHGNMEGVYARARAMMQHTDAHGAPVLDENVQNIIAGLYKYSADKGIDTSKEIDKMLTDAHKTAQDKAKGVAKLQEIAPGIGVGTVDGHQVPGTLGKMSGAAPQPFTTPQVPIGMTGASIPPISGTTPDTRKLEPYNQMPKMQTPQYSPVGKDEHTGKPTHVFDHRTGQLYEIGKVPAIGAAPAAPPAVGSKIKSALGN